MIVNLENDERITIVTPQGVVVVGTNGETDRTLVTVLNHDRYVLEPESDINQETGDENQLVWIKSVNEI